MPSHTDDVSFTLWTRRGLGAAACAAGFLDALRAGGASWVPEAFAPHEPLRRATGNAPEAFSQLWRRLDDTGDVTGHVLFRTRRAVGASGTVYWNRTRHREFDTVTLSLSLVKYRSRTEEFWRVVERLFGWADASYGVVRTDGEFMAQHANPVPGDSFLGMRPGKYLPGIYHGNLFGSELVAFFGEHRLRTCPAVRNVPFPSGGWLITTSPTPEEWGTAEVLRRKEEVRRHLGEQVFFDVRDPDRPTVNPFSAPEGGGPQKVERAESENKAGAVFFASLREVEAFLDDVLLHNEKLSRRLDPFDLSYTPSSLADLDRQVAFVRNVSDKNRRALVLQIGAYFGEVVRRSLAGTWVIDRDSDMPAVHLPDGRLEYPLVRAAKLCDDPNDRLSDWYDFIARGGEHLLE